MATSPIVGDKQRVASQPVVASLPISVVQASQLADASDPVNNSHLSGKKAGAVYLVKVGPTLIQDIAIAQGSDPTSDWFLVSDGGDAPITPA